MGRETRIGLLVGLVFIVMFGLVLAEFVGGRGATQNSSAAAVENNNPFPLPVAVDEPLATPTPAASMTDPRITPAPLARDVAPAAGGDGSPSPVVVVSLGSPPPDAADPAVVRVGTPDAGDSGVETMSTASGQTVYIVEDRDSLIKIAKKLYGPGHDAEWKTILEANKATIKSETALKAGDKLIIPGLPGAKPTPAPTRGGVSAPPPAPMPTIPAAAITGDTAVLLVNRIAAGAITPAPSAGRTYVIQAGDTITKIARKMYNGDDSKGAVAKIMKANNIAEAEVGRLRPGAKLEIPI